MRLVYRQLWGSLIGSALLMTTASAQVAVTVTSNVDPLNFQMITSVLKTDALMMNQLLEVVDDAKFAYQTEQVSKNIANRYAAFANSFTNIRETLSQFKCDDCSSLDLAKLGQIKESLTKVGDSLASQAGEALELGHQTYNDITDLAQDVNRILSNTLSGLTPAQNAKIQAQLLGALSNGIQQTNVLLQASMQIQAAKQAQEQLIDERADLMQKAIFNNMEQEVRP